MMNDGVYEVYMGFLYYGDRLIIRKGIRCAQYTDSDTGKQYDYFYIPKQLQDTLILKYGVFDDRSI